MQSSSSSSGISGTVVEHDWLCAEPDVASPSAQMSLASLNDRYRNQMLTVCDRTGKLGSTDTERARAGSSSRKYTAYDNRQSLLNETNERTASTLHEHRTRLVLVSRAEPDGNGLPHMHYAHTIA